MARAVGGAAACAKVLMEADMGESPFHRIACRRPGILGSRVELELVLRDLDERHGMRQVPGTAARHDERYVDLRGVLLGKLTCSSSSESKKPSHTVIAPQRPPPHETTTSTSVALTREPGGSTRPAARRFHACCGTAARHRPSSSQAKPRPLYVPPASLSTPTSRKPDEY